MRKSYVRVVGHWADTPDNQTINLICLNTWDGEADDDVMFYMDGEPLCAGMSLPMPAPSYVIDSILSATTKE